MKRPLTAILSAALAISAGPAVQIVPAGAFRGRTGLPGTAEAPDKTWNLSDEQGRVLAARLNARHAEGRARFNFDYDHQTMMVAKNGQKAPASGWARKFEWRDAQGLYALDVAWTADAKAEIAAEKYAYISPVIYYDGDTGVVTDVLMASLTNLPDLMQQPELVAALNALHPPTHQESNPMLLAALLTALGLPAETPEQTALTAVTALKTKADTAEKKPLIPTAISAALGLGTDATEVAALSAVNTLKAKPAGTDATTLELVRTLQTQIAQLTAVDNERTVTGLVEQAIKDGKLLPAQKEWAVNMGKKEIAHLNAYLATAPVVAEGLGQQQQRSNVDPDNKTGLTTDELAVCSALGLAPEAFKAAAPAAAA